MAKINIKNLNNKRRVRTDVVERLSRFVLRRFPDWKRSDITIIFMSDREIRKLNKRYKHKDRATDVLCFCYFEGMPSVGAYGHTPLLKTDIYISTDTAISNAARFKTTFKEELYLYVIHGLLHMMGHRDDTRARRARLDTFQGSLLEKFLRRK